MVFIRKNIKILYLLVLPVYFFIVQNSILNKHTHFYANGIVVTHSHPVDRKNGKPINDHKHTKTEICFFHGLQIDYFKNSPPIEVYFNPGQSYIEYSEIDFLTEYASPILYIVPRGPPFQTI